MFTVDELEWFSRNAYNLALKNTSTWDLRCVIRMLNSCVQIIEYFPGDYSRENMVDLALKMLFSRFIISSALVSLARVQDHVEQQKRDYTDMRHHVAAFDKGVVDLLSESQRRATLVAMKMKNRPGVLAQQPQQQETSCLLDQQSKLDIGRKLTTLLVFDFEAALALGQWDDLGGIVAKVKEVHREAQGEKKANLVVPFQAMADCLLRAASEATGGVGVGVGVGGGGRMNGQGKFTLPFFFYLSFPFSALSLPILYRSLCLHYFLVEVYHTDTWQLTVLYSTMRKLVNELWLLETFDAVKLAKYTRCLFQATLPLDDTLAMNLLEEACRKARELREVSCRSLSRLVVELGGFSPWLFSLLNLSLSLICLCLLSLEQHKLQLLARRGTRMDGHDVLQPRHRLLRRSRDGKVSSMGYQGHRAGSLLS